MNEKMTPEELDKLLNWLNPNRELAAAEFIRIRRILTNIFLTRGCINADELADETIDRVAAKIKEIETDFRGEKLIYFVSVLRYVYKESLRTNQNKNRAFGLIKTGMEIDEFQSHKKSKTRRAECLEKCLKKLKRKHRRIILDYYQPTHGEEKITERKILAKKFSKSVNSLRVQAFRIKERLFECVENCVAEAKKM
ncbi:MAG: hypothetical protein H0W58_07765 [Acidobacteria bacterium]|nr:hypothetical protein [Acidobacteriota bacterium]